MNNYFYLFISIFLILLACGGDPTIERGKAFRETGDTASAIQQFQAALKQNPSNAEASYQLGLTYEGLGDATQAVNAFRNATKLAPERAEITLALGRVHWHNGNRSAAAYRISKAAERFSKKGNPPSISRSHRRCLSRPADSHGRQRPTYEQTFTEKGNMMTFTAKYTDDYSPRNFTRWKMARFRLQSPPKR